jgi:hypothetical protein
VINIYAPASDGNNPTAYVQTILGFINGPIAEVRAEMGWPSSAELAQQEQIQIGGRHSIGTSVGEMDSEIVCQGNGSINETALELSYDYRGAAKDNPIAAYDSAMKEVNTRLACTGPKMGDSCDVFVATVLRKTVDDKAHCCGAARIKQYFRNNPDKYDMVVDGEARQATTEDLQPGDIMSSNGHVMIYVEREDGSFGIADASHCSRTADHTGDVYFTWEGNFDVFRWKGGS